MNQLEKIDQAHKDGFKAGLEHSEPSKKTLEKFEDMQKEIKHIPYIVESLKTLSKHFDKGGVVCEIKSHVEKTNGRVIKLESWRSFLLGGWAVISLLFPFMFFFMMSNFKYEVTTIVKNEISTAIQDNNNEYFELE